MNRCVVHRKLAQSPTSAISQLKNAALLSGLGPSSAPGGAEPAAEGGVEVAGCGRQLWEALPPTARFPSEAARSPGSPARGGGHPCPGHLPLLHTPPPLPLPLQACFLPHVKAHRFSPSPATFLFFLGICPGRDTCVSVSSSPQASCFSGFLGRSGRGRGWGLRTATHQAGNRGPPVPGPDIRPPPLPLTPHQSALFHLRL